MAKGKYRAKARSYGKRGYGYAKRGYNFSNKSYGGKFGLTITPAFIAGAVAAFVVPDNAMLDAGGIALACAPVKGLGPAKGAAQGYVLGQLMQQFVLPKLGINVPNLMGGTQPRFNYSI